MRKARDNEVVKDINTAFWVLFSFHMVKMYILCFIVITKTHMKHKDNDLRSNLSRVCISRLLFAFCHMYPVTSGVQSYCLQLYMKSFLYSLTLMCCQKAIQKLATNQNT